MDGEDQEREKDQENRRPDFTREERARILRLAHESTDPSSSGAIGSPRSVASRTRNWTDVHARDIECITGSGEGVRLDVWHPGIHGVWVLHIRERQPQPQPAARGF